jgi:hypothetical protein
MGIIARDTPWPILAVSAMASSLAESEIHAVLLARGCQSPDRRNDAPDLAEG